jgi:hypothetical protein
MTSRALGEGRDFAEALLKPLDPVGPAATLLEDAPLPGQGGLRVQGPLERPVAHLEEDGVGGLLLLPPRRQPPPDLLAVGTAERPHTLEPSRPAAHEAAFGGFPKKSRGEAIYTASPCTL